MARTFNGTTDKMNCGKGDNWALRKILYQNRGDRRYSHPRPFELDNGDILLGYTSNEFQSAFQYRCLKSTDGGITFANDVLIASAGSSVFEGAFVQLPGVNGSVIVVYGEGTSVVRKISTDRGATWGSPVTIDTGTVDDPHPDLIRLTNGDLFCVWNDGDNIKGARSQDNGATWQSEITILNTADSLKDPSIVELFPNNLLVTFSERIGVTPLVNCKVIRSTDNGITWGSAATVRGSTLGTLPSPNLVKLDTGELLLFFSVNVNRTLNLDIDNNHIRSAHVLVSFDNGNTWAYENHFHSGRIHGDIHRVMPIRDSKGQCKRSTLWAAATSLDGKREYVISRFDRPDPFPSPSFNNLKVFTAWAWIKYTGASLNGSAAMYVMAKGGTAAAPTPERVFLQIQDNGSTDVNQIRCFINRSTQATSYWTVNNAIADNTWTFIAATFDDARGYDAAGAATSKQRVKFYAGTSVSNLAEVAVNASGSVTEGAGNDISNDDFGDLIVGSRIGDNARAFPGDIGPLGLLGKVLSLEELKTIMGQTLPSVKGAMAWKMDGIVNPEPYEAVLI